MKRIISMVVVVALMMCCIATTVMAAGTTIKVAHVNGSVGEVVSVDVKIEGNTGFGAFDMEVLYDSSALKIQEIKSAELTQSGFIGNADANWAAYSATANVTGDGTLFTVTFEVLEAGNNEVDVRIDAFVDDKVNNLTATVEKGSVHTHVIGTEWKSDAEKHWHECTCGEKADVAAHTWVWVTDSEATTEAAGAKHEECSVCGYEKGSVEIPEKLTIEEVLKTVEWPETVEEADVKEKADAEAYMAKYAEDAKKALKDAGYVDEAENLKVTVSDFVAAETNANGSFSYQVSVGDNVYVSGNVTILYEEVEEKKLGMIFPKLFNVKVECGEGGSVNTSETFKMAYGSTRTIKITADEGYEVADVIVNGKSVGAVEKYTIKGARTTYTVKVLFEEIEG